MQLEQKIPVSGYVVPLKTGAKVAQPQRTIMAAWPAFHTIGATKQVMVIGLFTLPRRQNSHDKHQC